MSEAVLHFSHDEYQARIARSRAEMGRRGLDLIIVSDPSNMGWLTGYDGWSFYVHQAVLLGLEGEPVWWGRSMDANGAYRTAFMAARQYRRLSRSFRAVQRAPPDGSPVG